jgi:hypothetical protein
MRIFFPDFHDIAPFSFAKAIQKEGWKLIFPEKDLHPILNYGKWWDVHKVFNDSIFWDLDNLECANLEILDDNPPDMILVTCAEVQHGCYQLQKRWNCPLVFYAGNNFTPYVEDKVDYLFTTDKPFHDKYKALGKNVIMYYPYIFFDRLKFGGNSQLPIINSYMNLYPQLFPHSHELTINLISEIKGISYNNFSEKPWQTCLDGMKDSMATIHLKPFEGYGYTIIESLAIGRPIILYKPYTENKTYLEWCIDNESAIIFSNKSEFIEKINKLVKDEDFCYFLQNSSSKIIREKINNDLESEKLTNFIIQAKEG